MSLGMQFPDGIEVPVDRGDSALPVEKKSLSLGWLRRYRAGILLRADPHGMSGAEALWGSVSSSVASFVRMLAVGARNDDSGATSQQ